MDLHSLTPTVMLPIHKCNISFPSRRCTNNNMFQCLVKISFKVSMEQLLLALQHRTPHSFRHQDSLLNR